MNTILLSILAVNSQPPLHLLESFPNVAGTLDVKGGLEVGGYGMSVLTRMMIPLLDISMSLWWCLEMV